MGRKNNHERFEPVDYTGTEIPVTPSRIQRRETQDEYDARWDARRQREERQRKARIAQGIDWSICLVPGCGEELKFWNRTSRPEGRRNPDLELPLCWPHMAVAFQMTVEGFANEAQFIDALADVNDRLAARQAIETEAKQAAFMARTSGDIYFVRVGDLVKVGWTRDLWQRLKSYGASAELLVSYPGTRNDETNLHRQLTPARAKGREWYEDGAIIAKFLDEALAKYGSPPALDGMWTKPKQIVAGKRAMRYR